MMDRFLPMLAMVPNCSNWDRLAVVVRFAWAGCAEAGVPSQEHSMQLHRNCYILPLRVDSPSVLVKTRVEEGVQLDGDVGTALSGYLGTSLIDSITQETEYIDSTYETDCLRSLTPTRETYSAAQYHSLE